MCEPYHSIVQVPRQDDQGRPYDKMFPPTGGETWYEKAWKKIKEFFHISKMGAGHSLASRFSGLSAVRIPTTNYEVEWWCRTTKLDGPFSGEKFDQDYALECADTYANLVSIGNLSQLRQFIERSVRSSSRGEMYVEAVLGNLVIRDGRQEAERRLIKTTKAKRISIEHIKRTVTYCKDAVIAALLWITRQRRLLVPEWADDDSLWTPDRRRVAGFASS